MWSSLDFPISSGYNLPRSPNIRRNLRNHLMMSKLPILWVRKLNHAEDLTWPPHNIGQPWARTQVSRIPIQKKRRPMPFPSQPGFPVFTSNSLIFLLSYGNIKLYQDFGHDKFSSVPTKMLIFLDTNRNNIINSNCCLFYGSLPFAKECVKHQLI